MVVRRRLVSLVLAAIVSASAAATSGAAAPLEHLGALDRDVVAAELAPIQGRLRDTSASTFGGLWIDGNGAPVVALTEPDPVVLGYLQSASLSSPAQIRIVKYPERELDRIHRQLIADQGWLSDRNIEVVSISTEIMWNSVELVLLRPSAAQSEAVAARFGSAVRIVSVDSRPVGLACTRSNCGSPYKAGLNLFKNTETSPSCTGGFIFRLGTSTYYWSTAGHCANVSQAWSHPFGTQAGPVTDQGWADNSKADTLLIRLASAAKASNQLFVLDTFIRSVTSKENPDPMRGNEIIGESVFKSGLNGITTGTLVSVNVTLNRPGF